MTIQKDTCPRCGWVVDYGCGCPNGDPQFPLITFAEAEAARQQTHLKLEALKIVNNAYDEIAKLR